jgi:hypothetical protein
MKTTRVIVAALIFVATSACERKREQEIEFVPAGTYQTRAEAQAYADRQNADMASVRADEKVTGVSEQALPCGKYVVVSIRNSDGREFWGTKRDTTGCPDQIPSYNFPTQPQTKSGGANK